MDDPEKEIDNSPLFTPLDIKDIIRLSISDFVRFAKENTHLSLDELKDLYCKDNKLTIGQDLLNEKQIEEIETIIKSNLTEGSFANAFAKKVAIQIAEYYQLIAKGSVTLFSKAELEEKYESSTSFMALVRQNERLQLKIDCLRDSVLWYSKYFKKVNSEMAAKFKSFIFSEENIKSKDFIEQGAIILFEDDVNKFLSQFDNGTKE